MYRRGAENQSIIASSRWAQRSKIPMRVNSRNSVWHGKRYAPLHDYPKGSALFQNRSQNRYYCVSVHVWTCMEDWPHPSRVGYRTGHLSDSAAKWYQTGYLSNLLRNDTLEKVHTKKYTLQEGKLPSSFVPSVLYSRYDTWSHLKKTFYYIKMLVVVFDDFQRKWIKYCG